MSLIQKRDFLQLCDILLRKLAEGKSIEVDANLLVNYMSDYPLTDVLNYMENRGHIKKRSSTLVQLLTSGKDFARSTNYLQEYDKEYRKEEIEYMEREDKIGKITREKAILIVTILTLILSVVSLVLSKR